MPEKGLSVATYAAGASLATIAIVYVFAPTYFLDSTPAGSSNPLASLTSRKTGVVGLVNAANDCFINSVLQALAGLGDLRIYLIRETHRRKLDDTGVYKHAVPEDVLTSNDADAATPRRQMPEWKIEGLQAGLVTKGLKDMLDRLNERPIYKKTISAVPFVRVLETAFRQRISRQQQDAQEFLQVVAERLCDEYHAGRRARRYARRQAALAATAAISVAEGGGAPLDSEVVDKRLASLAIAENGASDTLPDATVSGNSNATDQQLTNDHAMIDDDDDEDEDGFPMEGKIESQIECLTCGFKPRPSEQTFCTLTLNVPQASSTSLSACFDTMMKTEYIDEFKCEKCRLLHARQVLEAELAKSPSAAFQAKTKHAIAALQAAIDTDPEKAPEDVTLPDARYAPKRRIARHFRMVSFPKILAIHLSRSIYDASNTSTKNSAKVSFPETLPLGGLLQQRKYKLLGLVTHKGSHHSGHYESFRRQTIHAPFSTPNTFSVSSAYSPAPTPAATPRIGTSEATASVAQTANGSPVSSTPELPPAGSSTTLPLSGSKNSPSSSLREEISHASLPSAPTSVPREAAVATLEDKASSASSSGKSADAAAETSSIRSITKSTLSKLTPSRSGSRHGSQSGSRPNSGHGSQPTLQQSNGTAAASNDNATANGTAKVARAASVMTNGAADAASQVKRRKKTTHDRWWRISDEKVKEASTREVLGMQREVYLLFYELERDPYRG